MKRIAEIQRNTRETQICGRLVLEGTGQSQIDTGIGFFDHMLELFAKHGGFDLELSARGDLDVDQHHTVEDVGIVLGSLFDQALGDRKGINRAGYFVQSMDESLAVLAVDLGGRAECVYRDSIKAKKLGDLTVELLPDFFSAFARSVRGNVHARVMYGRSSHHKAEAIFKGFGRALSYACSKNLALADLLPSTKGLL